MAGPPPCNGLGLAALAALALDTVPPIAPLDAGLLAVLGAVLGPARVTLGTDSSDCVPVRFPPATMTTTTAAASPATSEPTPAFQANGNRRRRRPPAVSDPCAKRRSARAATSL